MSERPRALAGLNEIVDRYEGIILDLFGTVHDGIKPLPGAIDALRLLRQQRIAVCLLSNSPRRRKVVAKRLCEMGLEPQLYKDLVTSGELAFEALSGRCGSNLGSNYFHIGPPDLSGLLEGSKCTPSGSIEHVDFILCTGMDRDQPVGSVDSVLREALARKLVLICANPDHTVMIGSKRFDCAGALAARYARLGGAVLYYGKPHMPAYDRTLSILGLARGSVLAIGDGIDTDIVGARGAGVDTALVLTGIHRDQVVNPTTGRLFWTRLDRLCSGENRSPKFVMPAFSWSRQS